MEGIQTFIQKQEIRQLFQKTSIGIEREGHRIDKQGRLVRTPHPPQIDGSDSSFFIQRDFAESQLELVTPPAYESETVMDWLQAIHEVAIRSVEHEERLWPFSMPPALPANADIKVANLEHEKDIAYREYLVEVYGKKLQMISGIHFNMEINDAFIQKLFAEEAYTIDYQAFKSDFYLKLARNFLRYQWFIVYLFGATPYAHHSFYNQPTDVFTHPVRSIRNSHLGYINKADVTYSYRSLAEYAEKLQENVAAGRLIAEKEFYSNVRLRGGKTASELVKNGISYLEFRLFDIQPDAPYGITAEDIEFMRYFILYLVWSDKDSDMTAVERGREMKVTVAEEDAFDKTTYYDEGVAIISGMREMVEKIATPKAIGKIIDKIAERLEHPELTPAAVLYQKAMNDASYQALGTQIAAQNYADIWEAPYALGGFTDMELSTQILMFDAIQLGYQIEILDREDQMLRLSYNGHDEIVKNGNITSKDAYITYHLMENKAVTKQLLAEKGFTVPQSETFYSKEDAYRLLDNYVGKKVVIKPKSTNMGIGISIFKNPAKLADLQAAIDIAFDYDQAVLIEQYVEGTEYRFFVLDGETKAVLLRTGANIVGDGKHTINELIDIKNQDPLRGHAHRSPLEKLAKGAEERLTLKNQNLTFETIFPEGKQIFLRENSNISTGGDSIDVTEKMHASYKQLASDMASTIGAKITGLDLMITDLNQPAQADNYACIEANFNPMMMMHIYPAQGAGKRITKDVLAFLFPEKTKI